MTPSLRILAMSAALGLAGCGLLVGLTDGSDGGGAGLPTEPTDGGRAETHDAGPADSDDGGPPLADGGAPLADGGSSLADGGPPLVDGGSSLADGGPPLVDGGSSLADGGSSLVDGGSSLADGGSSLADGGSSLDDAGAGARDAGDDSDGGASGYDAGPLNFDAGPVPAGLCGTVSMLRDDLVPPTRFNEESFAAEMKDGPPWSASLSSSSSYAQLTARWPTSLEGDALVVRWAAQSAVPGVTNEVRLRKLASPQTQRSVILTQSAGTYKLFLVDGSGAATLVEQVYFRSGPASWIFHAPASGGLQVSVVDGDGIYSFAPQDVPADQLAAVIVEVSARSTVTPPSPVTVALASIEGLIENGVWCPAAELVDDFATGIDGTKWNVYGNGCGPSWSSEQLLLDAGSSTGFTCYLQSRKPVRLQGSSFTIKLVDAPASSYLNAIAGVRFRADEGNSDVWLGVRGGTIRSIVDTPQLSDGDWTPPTAPKPVWLRLTVNDAGTEAVFWYSSNSSNFTEAFRTDLVPPLDDARPDLALHSYGTSEAGASARIDDVNVP